MIYLFVFIALLLLTVVNAIVTLPGSSVVTPLLTVFMSPKYAIAFATIYFLISSCILVIIYKKYLRLDMLRMLLPSSVIGAVGGAFLFVYINELVAVLIVLGFVAYFTLRKIQQLYVKKHKNRQSKSSAPVAGLFSGFFQGGGFSGGSIRDGFLYSKGLSLQEVRATSPAVAMVIFVIATVIRVFNHQLDYSTLWLLIPLTPVLIAGTLAGRYITVKLSAKWQNVIIISVLVLSVIVLAIEALKIILMN